jgi:hypothetical protein
MFFYSPIQQAYIPFAPEQGHGSLDERGNPIGYDIHIPNMDIVATFVDEMVPVGHHIFRHTNGYYYPAMPDSQCTIDGQDTDFYTDINTEDEVGYCYYLACHVIEWTMRYAGDCTIADILEMAGSTEPLGVMRPVKFDTKREAIAWMRKNGL